MKFFRSLVRTNDLILDRTGEEASFFVQCDAYRILFNVYRLLFTSYCLLVIVYWLLFIVYWLPVIVYCLTVIGYRLLVIVFLSSENLRPNLGHIIPPLTGIQVPAIANQPFYKSKRR